MSIPLVKVFSTGEKPTAEDLNAALQILAAKFGALDGTDFLWPLVLAGDVDLGGNRLLRVRELFGALNLEEYGSDEQAFEQAINELSGGGLIFVPRNNVTELSRSIKIRSNRKRVNIYGAGHSSQLKLSDGADSSVISLDGAARFSIANLFINGNKDNNAVGSALRIINCEDFVIENLWIGGTVQSPGDAGTAQSAISIEDSRNFTVRNVWVRDVTGAAVRVVGCDSFDVSGCTVRDCTNPSTAGQRGTGIHLADCESGQVHGNDIRDCDHDGIRSVNCHDVRIFANRIKGATESGIYIQGESELIPSSGIYVNGNQVSGCEFGLNAGSDIQARVTANHFRGNVTPIKTTGENAVGFANNQVMDVKNHGIVTMGAGDVFVDMDIGVSHLPIQSIQATWKHDEATTDLQDSVLGAVYAVNGEKTVTFYTATAIAGAVDIYYSIFI